MRDDVRLGVIKNEIPEQTANINDWLEIMQVMKGQEILLVITIFLI